MTTSETGEPLLLYHDAACGTVRAAKMSRDLERVDGYADELLFQGRRYVRAGDGLFFWDYLVRSSGEVAGVVLVGNHVEESLAHSRLLTESSNVTRDRYGFNIVLTSTAEMGENDGAQEFGGSSVYMREGDCLLLLRPWSQLRYAFPLDEGLTAAVPKFQ